MIRKSICAEIAIDQEPGMRWFFNLILPCFRSTERIREKHSGLLEFFSNPPTRKNFERRFGDRRGFQVVDFRSRISSHDFQVTNFQVMASEPRGLKTRQVGSVSTDQWEFRAPECVAILAQIGDHLGKQYDVKGQG